MSIDNIEDWNKGNDSITNSIERSLLHEEWLKRQHKEVREKIRANKIKNDSQREEPVGFID